MHKKKNRKRLLILIVIAVCIMIGGYIGINYYFDNEIKKISNPSPAPIDNSRTPILQKQKDSLISNLSKYKQFGRWPIGKVELTPNRGNPFQEKIEQE